MCVAVVAIICIVVGCVVLASATRTLPFLLLGLVDCSVLKAPIDSAAESHSKVDSNSMIQTGAENLLIVDCREGRQKAQRSSREGQDRRDYPLEKPACEEHCSISAKSYREIKEMRFLGTEVGVPELEGVGIIVLVLLAYQKRWVFELWVFLELLVNKYCESAGSYHPFGNLAGNL